MKKIIIIVLALLVVGGVAVFMFVLPKEEGPEPRSLYTPGDYFVTNDKDGKNMVKTTIVLEVNKKADDEEFKTFMDENQPKIRDTIVFILRSKSLDELRSQDIKTVLTSEIVQAINEALEIDNVKTIYFNDYVVQ
ncbi:flagellar basal body-associated FliL family protein [Clostridia bacterium OttesenSCG-928-F22]|nr:flagellar basal body-associated FliL family protein [Clostridia bacterium OttesenSCG-928-F22]